VSTCGDCTLCCKVIGVKSLDKPRDKWCRHCTKKLCTIYDERPDDCRQFDCVWLKMETLPDEFRPDRCGFIITAMSSNKAVEMQIDQTSARLDRRLPAAIDYFRGKGLRVVELRGDMVRRHPPLVGPNAN
jgi:uncharacterized protein